MVSRSRRRLSRLLNLSVPGGPFGRCGKALDLGPAQLAVSDVGMIEVALGADPTQALESFLSDARGAGHVITAPMAGELMRELCLVAPCSRPLDVSLLE